MRYLIGIVLGCGITAFQVQAQEIRGVFVGASVGSFSFLQEDGGLRFSDSSTSYRFIGGYQFNSIYSLEAGWNTTGDFKEGFAGFDPAVGNVSLNITGDMEITTLRFLAMAPFSNMAMFGGAGFYDATRTMSFRFESPVEILTATEELSEDGLTVVGGIQYEMNRIAIRGEYEWFDTDDGVDATSLSVGVLFRF